jgi:hypothetical protein
MGDMYREICSWENLRFAHRRASRGKRGREAAAAFEYHLVRAGHVSFSLPRVACQSQRRIVGCNKR